MKVIAELKEYSYGSEVKVLKVENYIHANMVTLSLDGKTINLDSNQLIQAIQRCSLGFWRGNMIFLGILIGVFIGGCIGVAVMALVQIAKDKGEKK